MASQCGLLSLASRSSLDQREVFVVASPSFAFSGPNADASLPDAVAVAVRA